MVWCNRGMLPMFFGFCPSERAWNREMRRLVPKGSPPPYPGDKDASMHAFTQEGSSSEIYIVTVGAHIDSKARNDPVGFAAVHIWQHTREAMGEEAPSPEFEAYTVQHLYQDLHEAYRETRGRR